MALVLTKTGSFEHAITLLTELTRVDKKTPEIVVAAGIAGLRQPWTPGEVPESERELVYTLGDAMASAMENDYKSRPEILAARSQAHPAESQRSLSLRRLLYNQDADQGIDEIRKAVELAPGLCPRPRQSECDLAQAGR